jgi:hypothetical protein
VVETKQWRVGTKSQCGGGDVADLGVVVSRSHSAQVAGDDARVDVSDAAAVVGDVNLGGRQRGNVVFSARSHSTDLNVRDVAV